MIGLQGVLLSLWPIANWLSIAVSPQLSGCQDLVIPDGVFSAGLVVGPRIPLAHLPKWVFRYSFTGYYLGCRYP